MSFPWNFLLLCSQPSSKSCLRVLPDGPPHRELSRTQKPILKLFWLGALTLILGSLLTACQTSTVVINSTDDVVRIGAGVKGPVYVQRNGIWTLTGKTTLPEGWYAGPGPSSTSTNK
jgi:hypothetical protein